MPEHRRGESWCPGGECWAFAVCLVLTLTFWFVLAPGSVLLQPSLLLLAPLLIWGAFRFQRRLLVTALLAIAATAVVATAWGRGPFSSPEVPRSLLDLQVFLATAGLTVLTLQAAVSERADALRTLARSEQLFRQLLESAPDAMLVVDGAGRILLVNALTERQFGYRREKLLGQPIEVLLPERLRAAHRRQRELYAVQPQVRFMGAGMELVACRQDGSEFPAEISLGPMPTEQGLLVFTAVRDISDRKQAEAALRTSQQRFDLAVHGTDAGIWDWDLTTDEVYFSPRWKSMLGYADDELDNAFREWETRLHPEDRERALQTIRDYLDGRSGRYELEHRLRHKDGTYRWILARAAAVFDAQGKPCRMVGSHIDFTERRQAEEAVKENEVQLLAAQRIQKRLLPAGPPDLPGFDIAGASLAADFAAGDHYDYLPMADGRWGLVVGDVSGHGFAAALFMASVHTRLRALAETNVPIEEMLARANRAGAGIRSRPVCHRHAGLPGPAGRAADLHQRGPPDRLRVRPAGRHQAGHAQHVAAGGGGRGRGFSAGPVRRPVPGRRGAVVDGRRVRGVWARLRAVRDAARPATGAGAPGGARRPTAGSAAGRRPGVPRSRPVGRRRHRDDRQGPHSHSIVAGGLELMS